MNRSFDKLVLVICQGSQPGVNASRAEILKRPASSRPILIEDTQELKVGIIPDARQLFVL